MTLDRDLLRESREAPQDLNELETRTHRARVSYEHPVRRLHRSGASFREIAAALGLSHERIHQIVDPLTNGQEGPAKARPGQGDTCNFCGVEADPVGELIAGPSATRSRSNRKEAA